MSLEEVGESQSALCDAEKLLVEGLIRVEIRYRATLGKGEPILENLSQQITCSP